SDGEGGWILYRYYLQPATGTMAPFGPCQVTFPESTDTMMFTFANGATITALATAQPSASGPQLIVNGTITGGTGIFDGASGSFLATITQDVAHRTETSIPTTFTGSGTVTAPKAPGGLSVLPSALRLDVAEGSTSTASETLVLDNQGLTAEDYQVSATTASGGNWLSVSHTSGTVAVAATSAITVTANPAASSTALKSGIYEGLVTVSWAKVSVSTKVRLIVGGLGANLELSETGLTFQADVGASSTYGRHIQVRNDGVGSLTGLTAKTSVTGSGTNWLQAVITPVSGNPQASTVAVSVSPLPANAGIYHGRIDFALPGAANSPQSVTVALKILAGPLPDVSPGGLVFYASPSVSVALPLQTVKLTNLGTHSLSYKVTGGSGSPKNGAPLDWLTFSTTANTILPGSSATLTVQVATACFSTANLCGLSWVLNGGIYVEFKEIGYTAAIPVQLFVDNVRATLGLFGKALGASPQADASCVPSKLNGVFTSLLSGFQATVGLPVPIEVNLGDSCGQAMDSGAVVATFSSGDPAVTLTPLGGGQWTGTWTPQTAATQATVTVHAAKSDTGAGMLSLSGVVAASTATPIAYSNGIVNAASGASTIAPGAFIAIYGANFGATTSVASAYPFPALLGGTQVLLGGRPLPLYFTSTGQIDAI
ncbi:MAG: hypothetical protein NTV49_00795, partial [Kiritimatiellaeota bacterium]|nr:hypothetical protein [Kiritimatiellota bacterium]